jgi:hypothetical protein
METNFQKAVEDNNNLLTGTAKISIDYLISGMGAQHKAFPITFTVGGKEYKEEIRNINRTGNFNFVGDITGGVKVKVTTLPNEPQTFLAKVPKGQSDSEETDSDSFADDLKLQSSSGGSTNLTLAKLNHADGMIDREMKATITDKNTGKSYTLTFSKVNTSGQREFTAITKTADFCFTAISDDVVEYHAVEQ